ncbi:Extended synaptotagmin-2 [Acipenser ruthenus]|uniref:Extended synaptotagmin-2 n=1 Tax=Acipenser ruthenus TaxID=7906 RepID=A0A444U6G2_ACIRT|nr:Extended synaptotagmin-2 [Acipenser ruthenus]
MWPYICQFIDKLFHETIEPAVKGAHSHLSTFSFTKIDMGDKPLRINGVKVYTENVDSRQIILDMQISFVGNTEIDVEIKKYFCRAGVKSIQLNGTMRVILEPLIGDMPIIGAVSLFFLRKPLLDINWTGITNILDIPGLNGLSDTVISDIICNYLVLPNRITVPLVGDVQLAQLRFPMPKGVLRIHFLEAQDLIGKDTFLKGMIKGKSDPYAVIHVGRHLFQTKTIKENLNPKWKEVFEALVYENPGQQLEVELFDEDPDKDDFLGSLMIDLAEVHKEQSVDEWFVLDEVATGKLHLKLEWLTLLPTPEKLDQVLASIKADKGQANDGLSSSLLIIYLDSARSLPSGKKVSSDPNPFVQLSVGHTTYESKSGKKVSSDPNPFVQLSVGHTTYESKVRYKTNEPVWEEAFTFLIHNPKRQELDIEIKDEKHACSLGTVNLPLINVMEAEEMTLTQRFPIKSSGPNSTLKLKLALRILSLDSQQKSVSLDSQQKSGQPSLVQVKKSPNFTKDGKKAQPTVSGKTDSNLPATASTSSVDINRKPESYENPGASSSSSQRLVDLNKSSSNLNIASYPGSPTHLSAKEATPSIASDISHPYATQELRQRLRHMQNGTAPPHMPLGQVQLTVRHSSQRNRLIVVVHACRNLIAFSEAGSDPYIRMYLLPDKRRSGRRKTAVVKKTLNPVYDETFDFNVSLIEVHRRTLDVAVKNSGGFLSKDKGLLGKKDRSDPFDLDELLQEFPKKQKEELWENLGKLLTDVLLEFPMEKWSCEIDEDSADEMEVEGSADLKQTMSVIEGVIMVACASVRVIDEDVTYGALLECAIILNGILDALPKSQLFLQISIQRLCESWWEKGLEGKEELGKTAFLMLLEKSLLIKNSARNSEVRANAALLFTEAFPVRDPSFDNEVMDSEIQRQFEVLFSLLEDPQPLVRSTGVLGVCRIATKYWDMIPPTILTDFLKKLIDLASDVSSADVRCSVFKCMAMVTENKLSHPLLEQLLPALKNSLHDNSEKVRVAFVDLLQKIKAVRAAKFWKVCPMEHLLARLETDSRPVGRRIVNLLFNSFLPVNQSEEVWCERCVTLIQMNPMAARKFYQYAHEHTAPTNIAKLMLTIRRCLNACIQRTAREDQDDVENSNKENTSVLEHVLSINDTASMASLLEITVILWRSIRKSLEMNKEALAYTTSKFASVLPGYFRVFKEDRCIVPLILLASFMPAAAVPTFSCGVVSKLRSLEKGATENQYSSLIDCLCQWGQVGHVLEVITDWLTEAMPLKQYNTDERTYLLLLENTAAWTIEKVLPFLINPICEDEASEQKTLVAKQAVEACLTVCKDVIMVGLADPEFQGQILQFSLTVLQAERGYMCLPLLLSVLKEITENCLALTVQNQNEDLLVLLNIAQNVFQKTLETAARRLRKQREEALQLLHAAHVMLADFINVVQDWHAANVLVLHGVFSTILAAVLVELSHYLQKISHAKELTPPETVQDLPPLSSTLLAIIMKSPSLIRSFLSELNESVDSEAVEGVVGLTAVLCILTVVRQGKCKGSDIKSSAASVHIKLQKYYEVVADASDSIERAIYESALKIGNDILQP